jgi:hypothetical protein
LGDEAWPLMDWFFVGIVFIRDRTRCDTVLRVSKRVRDTYLQYMSKQHHGADFCWGASRNRTSMKD